MILIAGSGSSHLPKSAVYANENRYFTGCVLKGEFPERMKQEELSEVIRILKSL